MCTKMQTKKILEDVIHTNAVFVTIQSLLYTAHAHQSLPIKVYRNFNSFDLTIIRNLYLYV